MISDPSSQDAFPMSLTRTKRDEFLIEIRKKKNQNLLQKKRTKLYNRDDSAQTQPKMINDYFFENDSSSQSQRPQANIDNIKLELITLFSKTRQKLEEGYRLFYEALTAQAWNNLIPILKFLRDSLGDQPDSLPGKVVIDMGVVPHVLSLLAPNFYQYKELQHEIIWLLANISAGNSEDTEYLVEQNTIPILCDCLKNNPAEELHENIMWALANISAENNLNFRDQIIHMGVLQKVVRELSTTPKRDSYYRTSAWLIANLVRGKPFPSYQQVEKCFGALTHLMDYEDDKIKENSLLSLVYLSEEVQEANLKGISENNLITKIVACLNHVNDKVCLNAVKTVGNLALGNKKLMNNLYEHEIFKAMPGILSRNNAELKKEACVTLTHILTNEFDDLDYIVDYEILPTLIQFASHEEDETKSLATQCLSLFVAHSALDEVTKAVKHGLIPILLQNLPSNHTELVKHSLFTLYKLLEHGESLKEDNNGYNPWLVGIIENNFVYLIENLQNHFDKSISESVIVILNRFFISESF